MLYVPRGFLLRAILFNGITLGSSLPKCSKFYSGGEGKSHKMKCSPSGFRTHQNKTNNVNNVQLKICSSSGRLFAKKKPL